MKNLLLVTQGFPYGESERGFLPVEYEALQRHFQVSVLAFGTQEPALYPLADRVRHFRYAWPDRASVPGLLAQLKHPEVRADIALALRSRGPKLLKNAGRIATYSLRARQLLPQLRQVVGEQNIHIIYTYWCVQATLAALRLKREFPSLQVITRFHGADLFLEQAQDGWQPLRPYMARGCDRLLFVSHLGLDYFMEHWDGPWRHKAMVSYIGCRALPRLESAQAPVGPLVLISCASLIPLKRVSLIIQALALLPKEVPAHWHHLGDGELRPALEDEARQRLANRSHIHYTFHGHVSNAVLGEAYQKAGAQLFITTSRSEGLPVSIMEAYAMGVPVIATAVGGIPEMLTDGATGFLLPPNPAPAEVAAAIRRFASLSQAAKKELSQNAWECWQAHFDAKGNAASLMEALGQHRRGEEDQ